MGDIHTILATDCGSTTTKAILIEKSGDEYRLIARGEAPTTVEAPFDDVTMGVLNSVGEVGEITGRHFIENNRVLTPRRDGKRGADLYVSTSSAGGGLQMTVAGVVSTMTAESANRAALGAGAIVMDVIAVDDRRETFQRIERIRHTRPDMVLLAGGTDGGTITHVVEIAEMLLAADPKPRLGIGYRLPIVYAGNKSAREQMEKLLRGHFDLRIVDNIRPTLETENPDPAREAIHELFLEHVMQQAPGYRKLTTWVNAEIMPTPMAVGRMVQVAAERRGINVLAVDIGGATTDIFTVFGGQFHRTVSANLGMSYSIGNVIAEAGAENILRWVPFAVEPTELRNRLRNKMIRPTTIPQTVETLLIEQGVAREALRLALQHHKSLATTLRGVRQAATMDRALDQTSTGETIINMMSLHLIIGSGGVLSHAPDRAQSALMMLDAFQPEGVTELAVDSIFMMPHLGVLSQVHPEAALQVFERDCVVPLGTAIAPAGVAKEGEKVATIRIDTSPSPPSQGGATGGGRVEEEIKLGELRLYPLAEGQTAQLHIAPTRAFDVGAGHGRERSLTVRGGKVGIIVDARGRPLQLPADPTARIAKLREWLGALGLKAG